MKRGRSEGEEMWKRGRRDGEEKEKIGRREAEENWKRGGRKVARSIQPWRVAKDNKFVLFSKSRSLERSPQRERENEASTKEIYS